MTASRALTDGPTAPGRPFPEPGVRPRYAPDRTCRVTALDIGLAIDPAAGTLRGDTVVDVAPLPSGALSVVLDLGEVTVDAVETVDGEALSWSHVGDELRVDGVPAQGGRVRVRYHGAPSRGLYFTGPTSYAPDRAPMAWTQCQDEDGHHLFPCHDHPGQRCPVTLRITAPAEMDVVANGALQGQPAASADRATRTWTWVEENPIPAYLVVVVVGALDTTTTWALGGTLGVEYLVPAGTPDRDVERAFRRTPDMIDFFSRRFGTRYPWHRYAQVVVHEFIFGGMENAGATVLTDRVITSKDSALIGHDLDDLVAHELAHQWFGDLVTCQDWSQAWLNEGWATYSEALWLEEDEGAERASHDLWLKLQGYLGEDKGRYQRAITHYRFRNPIDLFDRHLYEKGSLVLHTLRHVLGEEAFWPAVQAYLGRHAFGPVHTRDLQRAMEEVSGRNLDGFFQQFVHGAGHPVLAVKVDEADGLLSVTVTQEQEGPGVSEVFELPLPLRIVREGADDVAITLPVRERTRTFTIPVDGRPQRVEIDPWLTVLADLTVKAPRDWLCASLREDAGPVGRIRAARALGEDGGPAAVRALADALAAERAWGVRDEIAQALAQHGGPVAREALVDGLDHAGHKHRLGVTRALAKVRHAEVVGALERLLDAPDPSFLVRAEALRGLGAQRADGLLRRCIGVLEEEDGAALLGAETWGSALRAAALDALGHTRDRAALPVLIEHTTASYNPLVRAAAARALGQLAEEVDATRAPAVDRLLELVADGPFRVRLSAIGALGRAGDGRAAGALRRVHQGDPDGRTARTAFEALQRLRSNDRSGVAGLARLKDEMEQLREENRSLRDRLDRLEGRVDGLHPPADGDS